MALSHRLLAIPSRINVVHTAGQQQTIQLGHQAVQGLSVRQWRNHDRCTACLHDRIDILLRDIDPFLLTAGGNADQRLVGLTHLYVQRVCQGIELLDSWMMGYHILCMNSPKTKASTQSSQYSFHTNRLLG